MATIRCQQCGEIVGASEYHDLNSCIAYLLGKTTNENEAVARSIIAAFVDGIGDCTCTIDYTSRGLRDPQCRHHEFEPELQRAGAWLAGQPRITTGGERE